MEDTKNKKIKIIYVTLSLIGIAISAYLLSKKLTGSTVACSIKGCDAVQSSKYSEIFGIPVAALGILYYLKIIFLTFFKHRFKEKLMSMWLVFGILFCIYLTYLEIFVIRAICQWCITIFGIIIVISIFHFRKLKKGDTALNDSNSG